MLTQTVPFQSLESSAKMFDSLLKEIQDRSAAFMPGLSDTDAMALQQTTKSAQEKFERFVSCLAHL